MFCSCRLINVGKDEGLAPGVCCMVVTLLDVGLQSSRLYLDLYCIRKLEVFVAEALLKYYRIQLFWFGWGLGF